MTTASNTDRFLFLMQLDFNPFHAVLLYSTCVRKRMCVKGNFLPEYDCYIFYRANDYAYGYHNN